MTTTGYAGGCVFYAQNQGLSACGRNGLWTIQTIEMHNFLYYNKYKAVIEELLTLAEKLEAGMNRNLSCEECGQLALLLKIQ